uniref:Putative secreted salivary protease inhibitor n=1 Tax=Ixodes scapularis TaxID=6945 RepID=A0A4D5RQB2_IXOSC
MKVLVLALVVMILVVASEGRRWPGMPGPGPCKAMFRRYKCVGGRCLPYIYGGCGPDGGGYGTMAKCRQRCHGSRFPFPGRPRNPHERRPVAN